MKYFVLFLLAATISQKVFANLEITFFKENGKLKVSVNKKVVSPDSSISVDPNESIILCRFQNSTGENCQLVISKSGKSIDRLAGSCAKLTAAGGYQVKIQDIKSELSGGGLQLIFSESPGVNPTTLTLVAKSDPQNNDLKENQSKKQPDKGAVCKIHKVGIAYYDALVLANPNRYQLRSDDWDKIIIYYFFPDSVKGAHTDFITIKLKAQLEKQTNRFMLNSKIHDKEPEVKECKLPSGGESQSKSSDAINASLRAVGGVDVTAVADGLAKFLVKRTKEELSLAFFDKFKAVLTDKKYKDLALLFPQTHSLLVTMGSDVYDYKRYVQNLREAFRDDIVDLDRNFPSIIPANTMDPKLEAALRSACYLAGELKLEVHPGEVLASYPVEALKDEQLVNVKGSIQVLQLISASLRDSSTAENLKFWVSRQQIRDLVSDKRAFQIYLGLLYQQVKNTKPDIAFTGILLQTALDSIARHFDSTYDEYKRFIVGFADRTEALNSMISSERPKSDSMRVEWYAKYFRASVDMIQYATKAAELPGIARKIPKLIEVSKVYFEIAYSATDMVVDINRKNYSGAINQAIHIYKMTSHSARTASSDKTVNKVNDLIIKIEKTTENPLDSKAKGEIKRIMMTTNQYTDDLAADASDRLSKLVQYGGFMASVATAKTSDEVEEAIEAFALPTGSSRIKKESIFSVSLNAYVGMFAGMERISKLESTSMFPWSWNSYGITAPVGFAAGWGKIRPAKWKNSFSASVFISLIDVGAIAAYRFKNPDPTIGSGADATASEVPTIQFKDIFAPGAFLSLGIAGCPLSINAGAQVGAGLRHIDVTQNNVVQADYSENQYVRYSVSLCVDIPIFNLFVKSAK